MAFETHFNTQPFAPFGRIRMRIQTCYHAVQVARMRTTLAALGDHQLAQIGISRSEIPAYAERIMKNG